MICLNLHELLMGVSRFLNRQMNVFFEWCPVSIIVQKTGH